MVLKLKKCRVIISIFLCVYVLSGYSQTLAADIPQPNNVFYVKDDAKLLSSDLQAYIVKTSEEVYKKTEAQVVVVTVSDLQGANIEEYANILYRQWGIGSKETNNGVLLLVGLEEKKVRIEVGYGLEGAIPDITSGRIIKEAIIPYFKSGDYSKGILKGYQQLIGHIGKEYNVSFGEYEGEEGKEEEEAQPYSIFQIIVVSVLVIILLILDFTVFGGFITFTLLRMLLRGGRGGGGYGGNSGGGGSSGGGGASGGW